MAQRLIVIFFFLATSAAADTVIQVTTAAQLETLLGNGGGSAADGTVLELAAGTYVAPTNGFSVSNPNRSLTLRAATPGAVFLDGLGSRQIFRYLVTNASQRGSLVFEGLTFRNGRSTSQSFGSAVTLQDADATFIDCEFESNVNEAPGNSVGTIGLRQGSIGYLLRSIVRDNTSQTSGAGVAVVTGSTLWCHECQFLRNRNNVAGHITTATGAGFVAVDESEVYVSNSRFEGNQAGFAGGAFDVKGDFGENPVRLIASNSTFVDNIALPHPTVSTGSPAVGGAGNVEDNTIAQIYNSRFFDNESQFGGALAVYRAELEIYDSVLRGNFATGRSSTNSTPRGGAIFAVSDDTSFDGATNRPTSAVLIHDTLFHGDITAGGAQTAGAHSGGCVYATGDIARQLGQGASQGGTQAQNSARLEIARSAFVDCDVDDIIGTGAFGGAVYTALAQVSIDESLFTDNDATGTGGAGGAIGFVRFTDATITDSTFANNSSAGRGGAMFMLGSEIDINGNTFFKNTVPGTTVGSSRGAAIFAGPQDGAGLGIEGMVRNSLFVENNGLAIYDDDRVNSAGVFNTVTYLNNDFAGNSFAPLVYRDVLTGGGGIVDPAGLNAQIVDRGAGNTTDKAPANDNVALASQPVLGTLLALPSSVIDQAAAGDSEASTVSYLAYAWCGECGELDGGDLTQNTGLTSSATGVHSLMVFDNAGCSGAPDVDRTATLTQAPNPAATLSASPVMITSGGSSTLSWTTPGGTFLDSALNQGEGVLSMASGSVAVSPSLTTNYTYFAITQEGGTTEQQKVYVDEEPTEDGMIFADGFESGNTSAW